MGYPAMIAGILRDRCSANDPCSQKVNRGRKVNKRRGVL